MAKSIYGTFVPPAELLLYYDNNRHRAYIPMPRDSTETIEPAPAAHYSAELISTSLDGPTSQDITRFLDTYYTVESAPKIGAFLIRLLEITHAIPKEHVIEDTKQRHDQIMAAEQLLIDYELFIDETTGMFDQKRFNEHITHELGKHIIALYPITRILQRAVITAHEQGTSDKQQSLTNIYRLVLIAIAKQRGIYNSDQTTKP